MKRSRTLAFALATILVLAFGVSNGSRRVVQHEFQIEEYERFHDVLEPLEHEALPQKDFRRIRQMADELVIRGKAIVRLGVPDGYRSVRRFAKARKAFDRSLVQFKLDARTGSNRRLKRSFAAVHASFERLAEVVPVANPGPPPAVVLDCPGKWEAGSNVTLSAMTSNDPELFIYAWSISGGKIVGGESTRTLTVDTAGLAGTTISVEVTLNDGNNHRVSARCAIEISPGK